MTEQNQSTETVNQKTAAESQEKRKETVPNEQKRSGLVGNAIAIAIILAIGGGLYFYTNQQNTRLTNENNELKQQMVELMAQQKSDNQRLNEVLQSHLDLRTRSSEQEQRLNLRMQELQALVTALSSTDVKSWLIAQADFMVKMAGRKLWNDHDPVTAAVLLKSADSSLAEMNDPSLLDIRKAINSDISKLAAINQIDYDGIILRLNQLSNGIDNLRLADIHRGDQIMDEDNGEISGDISDWKQNLARSWKSFTNDFITIRPRDSSEAPLLAPNQDIYIRENIRSQLLIAAQAVPRYQEETYKLSLEQVSTWVRAYFDVDDPATKAFLSEIDDLLSQTISAEMPEALESQAKLEKVMQVRVRNLLAQASEGITDSSVQPTETPQSPEKPEEQSQTAPSTKSDEQPAPATQAIKEG
nr:uroporphyrinogen-III C-methyltransferase [uncultured Moellerella sp.]